MNIEESEGHEIHKKQKRPPRPKRNPIETAIKSWYEKHENYLKNQYDVSDLITQAPKRWTAYGPLVLLPAGSFTTAAWRDALASAASSCTAGLTYDDETPGEEDENLRGPALLWKTILAEIAASPKANLTHLTVNEGIPLHSKSSSEGTGPSTEIGPGTGAGETGSGASENILRSPSGLRMLYGDFGPYELLNPQSAAGEGSLEHGIATEEDFSRAFWVSAKQSGITQTWAPRWTMFSRGNVKEKARILDFHSSRNSAIPRDSATTTTPPSTARRGPNEQASDLSHRHIPATQRLGALAIDLYAGIGYFAFCYAAQGFRVLCWELNPWSVEGLRRGAEANGWSMRVIHPRPTSHSSSHNSNPDPNVAEDAEAEGEDEEMLRELLAGNETIVVFLEDNARAADRIRKLDELTRAQETQHAGDHDSKPRNEDRDERRIRTGVRMSDIMHVNCGLLPTSRGSWGTAWEIAREAPRAWLHIHENVGVADIEVKREEIREWFVERAQTLKESSEEENREVDVCAEHVELVKTFAPDVWHCVFDLYVTRPLSRNDNVT
ncbi:S-adenosyl-L-methionine-dependent methyltransferase [Xylaria sp. FL0064]|nr:S-adenosyl-L-methionine-dependent methyltransferase [Xylaria sp. FL0064]